MLAWFSIAIGTIFALLPIANPLSTSALFLALTTNHTQEQKRHQAKMACIYMAGILITFLVAGALIMKFFGISMPAVRIAGGLIVAKVGFSMMNPQISKDISDESKEAAKKLHDISFTPLAMPSLSGPGSIAVVIGMAPSAQTWLEHSAIVFGILLVAFISWMVLQTSDRVMNKIGVAGLNAFTRVMGFLIVCVGIQFTADGVAGFIVQEGLKFYKH